MEEAVGDPHGILAFIDCRELESTFDQKIDGIHFQYGQTPHRSGIHIVKAATGWSVPVFVGTKTKLNFIVTYDS